jgi:hypothetical protein
MSSGRRAMLLLVLSTTVFEARIDISWLDADCVEGLSFHGGVVSGSVNCFFAARTALLSKGIAVKAVEKTEESPVNRLKPIRLPEKLTVMKTDLSPTLL